MNKTFRRNFLIFFRWILPRVQFYFIYFSGNFIEIKIHIKTDFSLEKKLFDFESCFKTRSALSPFFSFIELIATYCI